MRSYFFSQTLFCSTMSNNNASESVAGGVDLKFIMEALTSEVKRIFRAELEQFHERVEQSFEHPRNPPTERRRERLPRRGVRVEEEEYDGGGFEGEIDHDSVVGDRRYEGRLIETRNWEGNNLGNIKTKIPSFQGKNDPEAYLEWERKVMSLKVIYFQSIFVIDFYIKRLIYMQESGINFTKLLCSRKFKRKQKLQ